jgi:predicted solute-binding protein
MAHYTIFELERIEKVLQAKLVAAKEAYHERLDFVRSKFKADLIEKGRAGNGVAIHGSAVGYPNEGVSGVLSDAWEKYQTEDMDLMLLSGEVDLFERGINALYSYWNSSVEIFIDNMREKAEKEKPRYVINRDPDDDDVRYP